MGCPRDRNDAIELIRDALKDGEPKKFSQIKDETNLGIDRVRRALESMKQRGMIIDSKMDKSLREGYYQRAAGDIKLEQLEERISEQEMLMKEVYRSEPYKSLLAHSRTILPGAIAVSKKYGGNLENKLMKRDLASIGLTVTENDGSLDLNGSDVYQKMFLDHLSKGYPEVCSEIDEVVAAQRQANDQMNKVKTIIREECESFGYQKMGFLEQGGGSMLSPEVIKGQYIGLLNDFVICRAEEIASNQGSDLNPPPHTFNEGAKQFALNLASSLSSDIKQLKLDESNFAKKAELADKTLAEIVGGVIAGMHLKGRCEYCPKVLDLLESLEHLSRRQ